MSVIHITKSIFYGIQFVYDNSTNEFYANAIMKKARCCYINGLNARATLSANLTGTALPICKKAEVLEGFPEVDSK